MTILQIGRKPYDIPQGSVLGTLPISIFCNHIISLMKDTYNCNYVDDFSIYAGELDQSGIKCSLGTECNKKEMVY